MAKLVRASAKVAGAAGVGLWSQENHDVILNWLHFSSQVLGCWDWYEKGGLERTETFQISHNLLQELRKPPLTTEPGSETLSSTTGEAQE